jgi:excinuclease ABC subunit C
MSFDKKFGVDFLSGVPMKPGVYRFYFDDSLQYVGKANCLRERLRQYRNAGRKKKDRKHRAIVKSSNRIIVEVCKNEHDALLLENEIIQKEKPPLNIAGAFSFLYPCLGLKLPNEHTVSIAYTTDPDKLSEYCLYGSFRSRSTVRFAFDGLIELLAYIGHPERERRAAQNSYQFSKIRTYRRIPQDIVAALPQFMIGESDSLLELLILQLLDHRSAREKTKAVQESLEFLSDFYRVEVLALKEARKALGIGEIFVQQEERDALFISARKNS